MKRKLIWLVLALGLFLRIINLGSFPPGFNADEASFGYDAYSILTTGRDQWGNFLPVVLKSFGDFKSPLYAYISIPGILVFGLNEFSVRLPAVIIGTLAIYAFYLLVFEVLKTLKTKKDSYNPQNIALMAATLMAVNPWAIMISRGAVEAGLSIFFLPFGIYLFIRKRYFLSALIFGLNLFTYHSAKVVTSLIVLVLIVFYYKKIRDTSMSKFYLPVAVFLLFMSLLIYSFMIGGGSRIAERSITQSALEQAFAERAELSKKGIDAKYSKILHNKYTVMVKRFGGNFTQYLSPKFLLLKGAGDASYAMRPGVGLITVTELILLSGILLLLKDDRKRKVIIFVSIWIILSILPAALSTGSANAANRASNLLPAILSLTVLGLTGWLGILHGKKTAYRKAFVVANVIIGILGFGVFINKYFSAPPVGELRQMGYGYLEVSKWLENEIPNSKIIISRGLTEPQIFIAFANVINPATFQKATEEWDLVGANVKWVDQLPQYSMTRYTIKSVDLSSDLITDNIVVMHATELKDNLNPSKVFYYPDGSPNIYILEAKNNIYAKKIN